MEQSKKIGFVGAGKMSACVIERLLAIGYPHENIVRVVALKPQQTISDKHQIKVYRDNSATVRVADVVFLAVKPHMLASVCREFAADLRNVLIVF